MVCLVLGGLEMVITSCLIMTLKYLANHEGQSWILSYTNEGLDQAESREAAEQDLISTVQCLMPFQKLRF